MNILVMGTHSVARWLMLGISDLEHASVQYHTGSMSNTHWVCLAQRWTEQNNEPEMDVQKRCTVLANYCSRTTAGCGFLSPL